MKSHELARSLRMLADLLESSPNTDLSRLQIDAPTKKSDNQEIAVNLATLAALSQIDKQQWVEFAEEYNIPLDVRPRDASRDVIGKLLKYLESNPDEQERIKKPREGSGDGNSPELMKALSILLRDKKK